MGIQAVLVMVALTAALAGCARSARIMSPFADRYDGEGKQRPEGRHSGVDVWGRPGEPVLAAADGWVVEVGDIPHVEGRATCGRFVVLQHDARFIVANLSSTATTKYCHLAERTVQDGTRVRRGDVIGLIGRTGWRRLIAHETGYEHVHWELALRGSLSDPLEITVGCFDPSQRYPSDRLVLTYPVRC